MTVNQLVDEFLDWKKENGLRSPYTYKAALRPLTSMYGTHATKGVTRLEVLEVIKLVKSRGMKTKYFLSILKNLAGYAEDCNVPFISRRLIRLGREYDTFPTYLKQHEVHMLSEACEQDTFLGVRNRCLIEMYYTSGARLNELLSLTIASLGSGQEPCADIITEKSGEYSQIVWSKDVHRTLLTYLAMRISKNWRTDRLFINKNGKILTDRGVQHMLAKLGVKVLGRSVHPHEFRHSRGHIAAKIGGLLAVQKKLRHKNIQSSLRYARFDRQENLEFLAPLSK